MGFFAVLAAGAVVSAATATLAAPCAGSGGVVAAIFDAEICPGMDANHDGSVTAADLTALVIGVAPTRTATARPTPTATPEPNLAPVVPRLAIHRTFPGFEIAKPIGATDPNAGQSLSYAPTDLPEGADIDGPSGVFRWTPRPDQIGAFYADFGVTDDGIPPLSAAGRLPLAVAPLDACTEPRCEPATGCERGLVPLDRPCCAGAAPIRPAEPTGACPQDPAIEVGRNFEGFGRLYNCDRFRLIAATQASVTVRMNVRGRCVPVDTGVIIAVRLEAAGRLLVDRRVSTTLRAGVDGWAERLLLLLPVTDATPDLEGAEANLTVQILSDEAPALETAVRVVLTHDPLPDLP